MAVSKLNRMLNDTKAQGYRPVRWEMTRAFFYSIKAQLGLGEPVIATRHDLAAPFLENALFGLPIVIVGDDCPGLTLVSTDPGGDA